MSIPFDIIGFDLDGTLVDTSGDLTAAVNHVLDSVGRPLLSTETVKQHIGGGAKLMLQQGLEATGGIPGDDFRPLYRQMLSYYEANVSVHSRPFDGALDLLDQLDAMGVRYAVVTNKFESLAVKLLTDLPAPLKVRYIHRVENMALLDPLFVEVLACKLALEACETLTQSGQKRQAAADDYRFSVSEAVRQDAIENPPDELPWGSWLDSRESLGTSAGGPSAGSVADLGTGWSIT